MNVTDVVIILLTATAVVRGIELGLVRQITSATGLVAGLLAGAWLHGFVAQSAQTPATKAWLALLVLVSCAVIGLSIGEAAGIALKHKLHQKTGRSLDKADRASGAVVGGATLLLVVWLCAAAFAKAPLPGLQQQLKTSFIISQLNQNLPDAPQVVSKLAHLIAPNGFPNVFEGMEPRIDTDAPLPSIGELDTAVAQTRSSVVKVSGPGCGGISTGSGFVVAEGLVVTNAHVIAGVSQPRITDANGQHNARVVWFDPQLDMAVLRAEGLAGTPLTVHADLAASGSAAAVLGYPGGGGFTAEPATILESFTARGRDIYNQQSTNRHVYSLKGAVEEGNSGGPVIDREGRVIGLVFAKSAVYDQVGYALTMQQVLAGVQQAKDRQGQVSTGACTR